MDNTVTTTPGIKTTEFYTMLISQIVGLLVMSGHVTPQNAPSVTQYAIMLVAGVQMVLTAVVYIKGRVELKQTVLENNLILKTAPLNPVGNNIKPNQDDASGL